MSDLGILIVLFGVGTLMLVVEIFIPSHGILTVAGLGFLVAAVVKTFDYGGRSAGIVAILTCAVLLPTFGFLAIKYWPQTPIGRLIAPPNPVLTSADAGIPIDRLQAMVGQSGRAISPLRSVGICDFNGRRVSCVAETGMVDAGVDVEAIGIRNGTLEVRAKEA